MARLRCHARFIPVGLPTRHGVPTERVTLYNWLGSALLKVNRVEVHDEELYVSTAEMNNNPEVVEGLLRTIPDEEQRSLVILDLSQSPFHLVRDVFLFHVAGVVRRWLDSRPRQSVVLLLPGRNLPGRASMFWDNFPRNEDANFGGRLTVIANDGTMWPRDAKRSFTAAEYLAARRHDREWLLAQLELRIVRRLGHFRPSRSRPDHCARYFYDAEQAVDEIGELIVDWVKNTLQLALPPGEPVTLLSHGRESDWFHDAVAGAATVLNMPLLPVREPNELQSLLEGETNWVAPIFNVVHTGETFTGVVDWLSGHGHRVAPNALAVIVSDTGARTRVNGTVLDRLSGPHQRNRVPQGECPQCQLKLPHTPARAEKQLGIRAFDMWEMFLEAGWTPETFGAGPRHRYRSVPDMRAIFKRHGTWIAYKVQWVLRQLGAGDETAFVCPDEENVKVLAEHLAILLQDRQVTVRLPPRVIRSDRWQAELQRRTNEEWYRQLTHLREQRFRKIILIDETAGEKTTARGMLRVLQQFELEPLAYFPIVDFSPDVAIPVRTIPMYQVRNPRAIDR